MEDENYLDIYAVGVGLEYYGDSNHYLKAGDIIFIDPSNRILKDDIILGTIAKKSKYYDESHEILQTLIRCGTYELKNNNYVFFESEDIDHYLRLNSKDFAIGTIIYADNKKTIIDLGTISERDLLEEEDDYLNLNSTILPNMNLDGHIFDTLENDILENIEYPELGRKETKMENVFENMGFGKSSDYRLKLSINGIAVRQNNTGKFVVYNKDNNEFVDVNDMLIDIKDALFVLPSADVKAGDTVIHEDKIYYIISTDNNEIKAVSYEDCTQTILIPKTTMFGLKYFKKVFSLFGDNFANTGEILKNPMMLMALMDNQNNDLSNLLLMSNLTNGDFQSNPMLMAFLMKGNKNSDLSELLMLSMLNGNNLFDLTKKNTKEE